MQQTDKYKLNKPGVDDPIAIATLNENMDKVEGALDGLTAADAALDQRVTVLEADKVKMAVGTYICNHETVTVNIGFTPKAVILPTSRTTAVLFTVDANLKCQYCGNCAKIIEGGFQVVQDDHVSINSATGTATPFIAFG